MSETYDIIEGMRHRIAELEAENKRLREHIDLLVDKGGDMWAVLECHVPNCKELEAWDEALNGGKE